MVMEPKKPDFSIIIPTFNEKDRLPSFLSDLAGEISKSNLNGEIIIVDDGSTQENHKTYLKSIEAISQAAIKVLRHAKNKGKGAAIQTGFAASRADVIGFCDADGATSSQEVVRLLRIALSSPELDGVFGSRILMLGYTIDRRLIRHLSGRIFTTLAYLFFRIPVYDSQCGCKFFRKSRILPFLKMCKEEGYLFDIELIAIGYLNKLNFIEMPISWVDIPGSKVHLLKDGFEMGMGILRIRKNLSQLGLLPKKVLPGRT